MPHFAVKRYVTLDGDILTVGEEAFDLKAYNRIFAIGAGKATYLLVLGLEEVLGTRITDGFIAIKKGQLGPLCTEFGALSRIRVAEFRTPGSE